MNTAGIRRKALLCGPHFFVGRLREVCIFAAVMFIKPTKKWRNPEGDSSIMVPYTYYRLCESERDAAGKSKQRTVLGLGELLEFPTEEERDELAELLTALIKEGEYRLCSSQRMYDAAQGFYGKWLDEKREAEEARRRAEFTVHAIGYHNESRVFEQGRYVSAVADGELFVGILDSGVLLGGTLQLEHHHGQTVDEDDDIGYAVLDFGDVELVHHLDPAPAAGR